MRKLRIIERTHPSGIIRFIIQWRIFSWLWVDAGFGWMDSWDTLAEAQKRLWLFDESKPKDRVIWESEKETT